MISISKIFVVTVAVAFMPASGTAQEASADCRQKAIEQLGPSGIVTDDQAWVLATRQDPKDLYSKLFCMFDGDSNGAFDKDEGVAVLAFLNDRNNASPVVGMAYIDYSLELSTGGTVTPAELTAMATVEVKGKSPGKWYVSDSKMDLYGYALSPETKNGASLSFVTSQETGNELAKIKGAIGYVLPIDNFKAVLNSATSSDEPVFAEVLLAPWLAADGTINTGGDEASTLRAGFDTSISITGGPFDNHTTILSPYLLTDFDFDAEAYGFEASWEPYFLDAHLGGFEPGNTLFDFFWRLNLIADYLHVEDPGKTKLAAGTDYAWVGGTLSAMYFPFHDYFTETDYSLYASARYSHFWDALSGNDAGQFVAELGVNLNKDKTTALATSYTKGKNKTDLVEKDEVSVSLKVKY